MNRDYTVYYNGRSALDLGLVVEHRPVLPSAEPVVTEFDIPARDGTLHRSEGTVRDAEINVEFAFVVEDEDAWLSQYRAVKSWLYSRGDQRLIFSEDPDWYYDVVSAIVSDTPERVCWNGGRFTATFTVRGYAYSVQGAKPQTSYYNKFDISHPIYVLAGNVNATLTVNSKTVTVNIGQGVTIDTDLMLTYRTSNGTMENTSLTGNYEDLWLKPGSNSISITSGATLSVIPRWRKRL